ncbi:unnamed protein product [Polarella glacialis]|uniref:EF-hand domain-containing protein n=1 Tax=Polarella glacialis TaxID=89957 RepID=A0A813IKN8_POLGL|nr:unnamed protein product [Polarella glacialis]
MASPSSNVDLADVVERKESEPISPTVSRFHRVEEYVSEYSQNRSAIRTCRALIRKIQQSTATDLFVGMIILTDVCLGCYTIDLSAAGKDTPSWVTDYSVFCFAIYTLELLATWFVHKSAVFRDWWFGLDAFIVLAGLLEFYIAAMGADVSSINLVRFLRIFRMVRMLKIFRKWSMLKDLWKLVKMTMACTKMLFWSFIFCFVVMTCWSMIAVELLDPLVIKLANDGAWPDCPQCSQSFKTVMDANLTFFKTIVAGDSWGLLAMPMIAAQPWTAIIFIGSLLTIVFGVLNLIVAVVVDEFAEQRQRDVRHQAQELDDNHEIDLKLLQKMFAKIDQDGSGELSLEELQNGARTNPEFCDRLRVMDIDEKDLEHLFKMLDDDGSGFITPEEFIEALSRWINESKTASRFAKYELIKGFQKQDEFQAMLTKRLDSLERQLFLRRVGCESSQFFSEQGSLDAEETSPGEAGAEGAGAADALQAAQKALEEAIRSAGNLLQDSGAAEAIADLKSAQQACEIEFEKALCEIMPGFHQWEARNSISKKSSKSAVDCACRTSGEHASCLPYCGGHAHDSLVAVSEAMPPRPFCFAAPSITTPPSTPQMLRGPTPPDAAPTLDCS